jgi:hypothetical protein
MLVCHARALLGFPGGLPADDRLGFPNPAWDAVLESWLVHVRVLDEFLRLTRSEKGNAYAREWYRQWSGGFLDDAERRAIDRQVTHLNARRRSPAEWDVRGLTEAACAKLIEFCDAVRARHPERHDALVDARGFVERFLDGTLAPDDCSRAAARFER